MHSCSPDFFNLCEIFSAEPYVLNCQFFKTLLKIKMAVTQLELKYNTCDKKLVEYITA